MKKNLSKLERVTLREAWKHEATEFTPWLAESENLDSLAEPLGMSDLMLVATEHWDGARNWPPSSGLLMNTSN